MGKNTKLTYEKRRREVEKKRKRADKLARKHEKKEDGSEEGGAPIVSLDDIFDPKPDRDEDDENDETAS